MKRRLLLVAAAGALLAAGCQTGPTDRVASTEDPQALADVAAAEAQLIRQHAAPDAGQLARLRSSLAGLRTSPGLSRRQAAHVDALAAEAALLAGAGAEAARLAEQAAAVTDAEEGAWVVRALLEKDSAKRLVILERGLAAADTRARLTAERGELLLAAGRYAEAAQDLSEGVDGAGPWGVLYAADRDRALALARAGADTTTVAPSSTASLSSPLTLRGMVETTRDGSRFLSTLTTSPSPSFADALPALRAAGLLLEPVPAADAAVARREVAWFLWGLVARQEHDPKLLTKYRQKYTASPVPDVAVTDPWFDAALGTVEMEIMDLPDGVHFQPAGPVTGLDLVAMLARMKKLFP